MFVTTLGALDDVLLNPFSADSLESATFVKKIKLHKHSQPKLMKSQQIDNGRQRVDVRIDFRESECILNLRLRIGERAVVNWRCISECKNK
jgi:hypothetical protein